MPGLNDLLGRVRAQLGGMDARLLTDDLLREACTAALEQINTAAGQTWTLSGLDGALDTSLPAAIQSVLVLGTAAHALDMRALQRVDAFDLNQEIPQVLGLMAHECQQAFSARLEQLRRAGLSAAAEVPWGGWTGLED